MQQSHSQAEYIAYEGHALVLRLARFVWQMHVLSAVLLCWALWGVQNTVMLLAWSAWMIILGIAQGILSFRGSARARDGLPLERFARAFDISAVLLALGWGWLALVLTPADNLQLATFVGFVISGGILTGTGTHNMHYPMLATTLSIIIPAQAIRAMIDNPGLQGWINAGMLILFLGLMLGLGWVLRGFTRRGLILQWEKMELAEQLDLARAEAETANEAKSRFLAQASHDLRQPIHAMGLLLGSLTEEAFSPRAESVIARIRQSVDSLAKLFTSLLDVTLLDTRQIVLTSSVFDLRDLIQEVADEFEPAAKALGCDLSVASDPTCIQSDPLIVRRILQNLIANAIRHGEGTRILISCDVLGEAVSLSVRDYGPGIAKAEQARMFEAFERGGNVTDAADGLGLGLAIVKRLADIAGVNVELTSELGEGAMFKVGLFRRATNLTPPVDEPAMDEIQPASDERLSGPVGRVLIIDDDRATLEATGELLRRWGWEVALRRGGPSEDLQGLDKPDLILSDYDLGGGHTGLEAVGTLQEHFGDIPALLMTGSSSPEARAAIESAGFLMLLKPVRPAQLRSAVISLVG